MTQIFGGIEGGGTKFVAAVGTVEGGVLAETRIKTTTPAETLVACVDFFKAQAAEFGALSAIGIASFGPVDLRKHSATYGHILPTPKPYWTNTNLLTPFRDAFDLPIGLDTDVNGAALGEWHWGAARGVDTFLYLTIGTGIGGSALINGKVLHGLLHPEMGHISVPKMPEHTSICPFHEDCFEGLASGPALEHHWGEKAENFDAGHPAWDAEASYIASALRSFICTLSPQRIILGGGVMSQSHLFPLVREKTLESLSGYIQAPEILENIDEYIVPVALDGKAGILGAFVLAKDALLKERRP